MMAAIKGDVAVFVEDSLTSDGPKFPFVRNGASRSQHLDRRVSFMRRWVVGELAIRW